MDKPNIEILASTEFAWFDYEGSSWRAEAPYLYIDTNGKHHICARLTSDYGIKSKPDIYISLEELTKLSFHTLSTFEERLEAKRSKESR